MNSGTCTRAGHGAQGTLSALVPPCAPGLASQFCPSFRSHPQGEEPLVSAASLKIAGPSAELWRQHHGLALMLWGYPGTNSSKVWKRSPAALQESSASVKTPDEDEGLAPINAFLSMCSSIAVPQPA